MQRRTFLLSLIAASVAPRLATAATPAFKPQAHWFSSRGDLLGNYHLSGFSADGSLAFDLPLPARGHGIALHPDGTTLVQVARRPGRYLLVVDANSGEVLHELESAEGRHFCGHGLFSADGRTLYTTENDYEGKRGVIGVRDATRGYLQVGEFDSHGIGPHDLRLLSDQRTLVVANGGILTHPDTPRAKLNLDTMQPSLVYLDRRDGALLEQVAFPATEHQNSIRHLAVGADDTVCLVMQHQGPRSEHPPLIALHRRGEALQPCTIPDELHARMRNYCGSATVDPSGALFAVSSPRGGLVTYWSAKAGEFLGHTELADGCGIAAGELPGEFILSSGRGDLVRHRIGGGADHAIVLDLPDARWDNHMVRG